MRSLREHVLLHCCTFQRRSFAVTEASVKLAYRENGGESDSWTLVRLRGTPVERRPCEFRLFFYLFFVSAAYWEIIEIPRCCADETRTSGEKTALYGFAPALKAVSLVLTVVAELRECLGQQRGGLTFRA